MLDVRDIHTYYGQIHALKGISLTVNEGEIVTLIGSNGAGKSTTLKTISGLLTPRLGDVTLKGQRISGLPAHRVAGMGIAQSPEGRRVFPRLSVLDNLRMGAHLNRSREDAQLTEVFTLFPRLRERTRQLAGSLSGGEQQMLAIGRALMAEPRLLAIDELSLGLAPVVVQGLSEFLLKLNEEEGVALLLVEQNALLAFELCERAYVLEAGRSVLSGTSEELRENSLVQAAYLGGGLEVET